MLNLNRRLEAYLGRVQLLEEENALLSGEIRGLRSSGQEVEGRRRRRAGLEEELRRARLEVEAAWGDRVHADVEAGRAADELRVLEERRRREAEAQEEAEREGGRSREELEEERRDQVRLREQVGQLEDHVRNLIRTHHQDVARLGATVTRSRGGAPQGAAEAHLDQLEDSLDRARSHLAQVGQEKSQSRLQLRALEEQRASAQTTRRQLETSAARQGDRHHREVLHLQVNFSITL